MWDLRAKPLNLSNNPQLYDWIVSCFSYTMMLIKSHCQIKRNLVKLFIIGFVKKKKKSIIINWVCFCIRVGGTNFVIICTMLQYMILHGIKGSSLFLLLQYIIYCIYIIVLCIGFSQVRKNVSINRNVNILSLFYQLAKWKVNEQKRTNQISIWLPPFAYKTASGRLGTFAHRLWRNLAGRLLQTSWTTNQRSSAAVCCLQCFWLSDVEIRAL